MNKTITIKNFINISLIILNFLLVNPTMAVVTSLEELQQLSSDDGKSFTPQNIINTSNWAYKILENISNKHSLILSKSIKKFELKKPITRIEAAELFVNIGNMIEQNKIELTESEKAQIDILKQELKCETSILSGKIDYLESNISQLNKKAFQLKENSNKNIKTNMAESFIIEPAIQFRYSSIITKGEERSPANFSMPLVQVKFKGKLQNGIEFLSTIVPGRNYDNSANSMLTDAYIMTDKLKYHKIYIGQTRTPIGYEGTLSRLLMDTPERSQVSRNFSGNRDKGIKTVGSFPLIDYTLGVFNGNNTNKNYSSNSSLNYGAWLVFKPLYLTPKRGKLEIGGGNYSENYSNNTENIYKNDVYLSTNSLYSSYEFKKNKITAEWAQKNGYNSIANQKAEGWYIQNALFLNKIKTHQLIAKFDTFNPNTALNINNQTEYTLGYNYYKKQNNLKFMFDFIHMDKKTGTNSNQLIFQTQCFF